MTTTPQVDFYLLRGGGAEERLRFTCRLVEKAWQRGHRIFVHTASADDAESLDRLLWTFREESFVPHARVDRAGDPPEPVLIGDGRDPPGELDLLINLSDAETAAAARAARVAEVVASVESARQAARARYRAYRESGHPLEYHEL
ncbi:MAG: DNA polymerase III subunit chi [Ectothiorhodospiraceae bacterium]|nr:DNA polymerase III subunit chi [Chromatiales bacterium]MCP5154997.1 DNA polymerase III subunit chi [Ectothiorhodospiraceae bacterium]